MMLRLAVRLHISIPIDPDVISHRWCDSLEWEADVMAPFLQRRSETCEGRKPPLSKHFLHWYGTTSVFKHVLMAHCKLLCIFFLCALSLWNPPLLLFSSTTPWHLSDGNGWAMFMTAAGTDHLMWFSFFFFLLALSGSTSVQVTSALQLGGRGLDVEWGKNVWA